MEESVLDLLKDVQLEQFYVKIRDQLQITQLSHFDYVKSEDLEKIGMGKPAIRRLMDCLRKQKSALKKKQVPKKRAQSEEATALDVRPKTSSMTVSCLILDKDIKLVKKLGDGSFGVVKQGEWKNRNEQIDVAVKILHSEVMCIPGALEDFLREVNLMHKLEHEHLIKLYGVVMSSPLMMVTELAENGAILDQLRVEGHTILVKSLCEYMCQIADGMAYLERRCMIHRDLAARNVLLSKNNKIKICDFGLMRSLSNPNDQYVMPENRKIPYAWCAPESLRKRIFTHCSDVWMFGVTLWEMFTYGDEPWVGLNATQILVEIENNERLRRPFACPTEVYKLMLSCWHYQPDQRPSFAGLKTLTYECQPRELKAVRSFSKQDNDQIDVQEDDIITVIDGRVDWFYWRGQNRTSCDIGKFPRSVSSKELVSKDISRPLKLSLIHAGHGDPAGNSWGDPSFIDDVYLTNPQQPEDLLSLGDESNLSPLHVHHAHSRSEPISHTGSHFHSNSLPGGTEIRELKHSPGAYRASSQNSVIYSYDQSALIEPKIRSDLLSIGRQTDPSDMIQRKAATRPLQTQPTGSSERRHYSNIIRTKLLELSDYDGDNSNTTSSLKQKLADLVTTKPGRYSRFENETELIHELQGSQVRSNQDTYSRTQEQPIVDKSIEDTPLIDLSTECPPPNFNELELSEMTTQRHSDLLSDLSSPRYGALPKPLLDMSNDPFHVGDHIKSYVYESKDYRSPQTTTNSQNQLSLLLHNIKLSANQNAQKTDTLTNQKSESLTPSSDTSTTCDRSKKYNDPVDVEDDLIPPPLPPREHLHSEKKRANLIRPINMGEGQVSHTHYFLLAPKPGSPEAAWEQRNQSKQAPLAAVKPYQQTHTSISHKTGKSRFFTSYSNNAEPDYVNQDEIDRMAGPPRRPPPPRLSPTRQPKPPRNQPQSLVILTDQPAHEEKSSLSPRAQVEEVNMQVPGTCEDEAYAALQKCHWNMSEAVRYLKVEQLFRLGVTTRHKCTEELVRHGWDIEKAASSIIDSCQIGISV